MAALSAIFEAAVVTEAFSPFGRGPCLATPILRRSPDSNARYVQVLDLKGRVADFEPCRPADESLLAIRDPEWLVRISDEPATCLIGPHGDVHVGDRATLTPFMRDLMPGIADPIRKLVFADFIEDRATAAISAAQAYEAMRRRHGERAAGRWVRDSLVMDRVIRKLLRACRVDAEVDTVERLVGATRVKMSRGTLQVGIAPDLAPHLELSLNEIAGDLEPWLWGLASPMGARRVEVGRGPDPRARRLAPAPHIGLGPDGAGTVTEGAVREAGTSGVPTSQDLLATFAPFIPMLRRYARMLTGDTAVADSQVRETLGRISDQTVAIDMELAVKVALYKTFHANATPGVDDQRQAYDARSAAYLLTEVEGFETNDAASILGVDPQGVQGLLEAARAEIAQAASTHVLVIEDEPMIAADLKAILLEGGHTVFIAESSEEAMAAIARQAPGLVVANLLLRGRADGVRVVSDILARADPAVVYLTGSPFALELGEPHEPAFVLAKPYDPDAFWAVVAQALFVHRMRSEGAAPRERQISAGAGSIAVDREREIVMVEGVRIRLTRKEYAIIDLLDRRVGEALSRDDLIAQMYRDKPESPPSKIMDVFIAKLRKKLGPAGGRIITLPGGAGFCLTDPTASTSGLKGVA